MSRLSSLTLGVVVLAGLTLGCDRSPGGPSPVARLAITSVSPSIGLTNGSTLVSIFGTGFDPDVSVIWDGVQVPTTVVNQAVLTVTVPSHAAGPVDIVVTNHSGKEIVSRKDAFRYIAFEIGGFTPSEGLPGTLVEIRGNGFRRGLTVTFDGVPATYVEVTNLAHIIAIVPEHGPGQAAVVVRDTDGETLTAADPFTFQTVTLTVNQTSFAPEETLTLNWTGPARQSEYDWIALYRVGSDNFNYEDFWWDYTHGIATGSRTLTAPSQPGTYEFRFFVDDGYVVAARSAPFIVRAF